MMSFVVNLLSAMCVCVLIAAAAAVQAQYRMSLPAVEYRRSHSPSASPAPRKRLMSDEPAGHRDEEDAHQAAQRRRRFTTAASMALRQTMDGPRHGEDGEEVTAKNLRSLLAKTAAANVSNNNNNKPVGDMVRSLV